MKNQSKFCYIIAVVVLCLTINLSQAQRTSDVKSDTNSKKLSSSPKNKSVKQTDGTKEEDKKRSSEAKSTTKERHNPQKNTSNEKKNKTSNLNPEKNNNDEKINKLKNKNQKQENQIKELKKDIEYLKSELDKSNKLTNLNIGHIFFLLLGSIFTVAMHFFIKNIKKKQPIKTTQVSIGSIPKEEDEQKNSQNNYISFVPHTRNEKEEKSPIPLTPELIKTDFKEETKKSVRYYAYENNYIDSREGKESTINLLFIFKAEYDIDISDQNFHLINQNETNFINDLFALINQQYDDKLKPFIEVVSTIPTESAISFEEVEPGLMSLDGDRWKIIKRIKIKFK